MLIFHYWFLRCFKATQVCAGSQPVFLNIQHQSDTISRAREKFGLLFPSTRDPMAGSILIAVVSWGVAAIRTTSANPLMVNRLTSCHVAYFTKTNVKVLNYIWHETPLFDWHLQVTCILLQITIQSTDLFVLYNIVTMMRPHRRLIVPYWFYITGK